MYGEMTDKETIQRVDDGLDNYKHDQLEILLYKKNRMRNNVLPYLKSVLFE